MKQYLGLGLGVLVGTVIGAAAVSGLHAQAKPPVYLVTEIDVTNPEGYGKEYAPKAQANIKAAGGRFVALGGTGGVGARQVTALSGTPPKRATIIAWDNLEFLVQQCRLPSNTSFHRSSRVLSQCDLQMMLCSPDAFWSLHVNPRERAISLRPLEYVGK